VRSSVVVARHGRKLIDVGTAGSVVLRKFEIETA
jgi:hypothetical protein